MYINCFFFFSYFFLCFGYLVEGMFCCLEILLIWYDCGRALLLGVVFLFVFFVCILFGGGLDLCWGVVDGLIVLDCGVVRWFF